VPVLSHIAYAAGLQLLSCSLGLSAVLALLDTRSGLVRDHPPLAWRVAGILTGPLAVLSLAAMLLGGAERWVWLGLAAPYAVMAMAASWTWYRGARADRRRQCGREAAILGVVAALFASLGQTGGDGLPALALAASLGTAALVGGLGVLALGGTLGSRRDVMEEEGECDGIAVRAVATGLGITLLAASDVGRAVLLGGACCPVPVALWLTCSLLVPLVLLVADRKAAVKSHPSLWCAACAAALIGQFALQTTLVA